MAIVLYSKDLVKLTSADAQVIVCPCYHMADQSSFKEAFPSEEFDPKAKPQGSIKVVRVNKRLILKMYGTPDNTDCLHKISKIKGLKSIAFYLPDKGREVLDEWAKENSNLTVFLVTKDKSLDFLQWVWEELENDPWIDESRFTQKYTCGAVHTALETISEESETTILEYLQTHTPKGWEKFFKRMEGGEYLKEISNAVEKRVKAGDEIYPPLEKIFTAFEECSPQDMKVIIIGQDPYHTPGAAMGMCFSTPEGRNLQPSVKNIFKELKADGFIPYWECGDLTYWAQQGVFLINTALTVKKGEAGSHGEKIWGNFTGQLFRYLNDNCDHLVVIAWGNPAQRHAEIFSSKKHKKITSSHPSPFSANKGFFGSKPFSRTNEQLKEWGKEPIDWSLAE